ncbi:hypothetical protein FB451DRAFT_517064 [Mycena latifolia]|nr:hypothetical protein FB451DRAFT_517064 [Mycena latifolia]
MGIVPDHAFALAASWLNCILFILEIVLIFQYFRSPRPLLHRLGVVSISLFDVACTSVSMFPLLCTNKKMANHYHSCGLHCSSSCTLLCVGCFAPHEQLSYGHGTLDDQIGSYFVRRDRHYDCGCSAVYVHPNGNDIRFPTLDA